MTEKDNQELVTNILSVTRDQLNRAMALCAELEALLNIEKRKNAELASKLNEPKGDGK
jgi:hypothetical protein